MELHGHLAGDLIRDPESPKHTKQARFRLPNGGSGVAWAAPTLFLLLLSYNARLPPHLPWGPALAMD